MDCNLIREVRTSQEWGLLAASARSLADSGIVRLSVRKMRKMSEMAMLYCFHRSGIACSGCDPRPLGPNVAVRSMRSIIAIISRTRRSWLS